MSIMNKSLKDKVVGSALKFIDKHIIEVSTRECMLLFFDEPEMPKEIIDLEIEKN